MISNDLSIWLIPQGTGAPWLPKPSLKKEMLFLTIKEKHAYYRKNRKV
jgi:hypothetical protein